MSANGRPDKGESGWEPAPQPLGEKLFEGGGGDFKVAPGRAAERRGEATALLERKLLLESLPGERYDVFQPGKARRTGLIGAAIVFLGAAAVGLLFVVEDRKQWENSVAALSKKLEVEAREAASREEALRRECIEKDKAIGERKAENQNLTGIAERTLVELKTSLDDLRLLRKENARLETLYHEALEARASPPSFHVRLPRWLLRAVDATLKTATETSEGG